MGADAGVSPRGRRHRTPEFERERSAARPRAGNGCGGARSTVFFGKQKEIMRRLLTRGPTASPAAGLTAGLAAALVVATMRVAGAQPSAPTDFADLVERTAPAVVNIRTAARVSAPGQAGPEADENDPLYDFFHRFMPQPGPGPRQGPMPRTPRPDREMPRGQGSGFLISADGYVLTNHHVVDGADEITVTLSDKREFKGKLVGSDQRTDVALVKIDGGSGLPSLKIGDPARLRVGEWVIAIGSPFGLQNTVTAGIVSAKGRETGELLPFIQTDAAVNPGNSGGPLISMRGEVVGINSQIFTTSGAYAGISFAIPIDEAMRIADLLRTQGKVVRGKIGVLIGDVPRDVADAIGLSKAAGALVSSVETDGPADKGGVQAGDVIIRYDGKPVDSSADLRRMVAATKPGTRVGATVWRNGGAHDLQLSVGEMQSDQTKIGRAERPGGGAAAADVLGLVVSDLSADQLKELRLKGGVSIESADGAAGRAGLANGDVIISINNIEIKNARHFKELVAKLDPAKAVPLLVRRGEQSRFFVLRPGDN
jgi:serine protease Do